MLFACWYTASHYPVERHNVHTTTIIAPSHHLAVHQVLVALPPILNMPLPPIFRDILLYCKIPAFSFVIDNLGMSCFVATDFYWQLVTSTLMPPAMIALLYLYNLCRSCFDLALAAKRSTGVALLILYVMLPVTSATIFSIFGCEDFDDGTSLLRTDFSVSCQDPRYAFFRKFALITVLIWPVGVPTLFAVILIRLRKELRNDKKDEDGELVRNNNRRIDRYAFFFDVYKPNCWWWENYESLRRVACTGVLVLFPVSSVLPTQPTSPNNSISSTTYSTPALTNPALTN